MTYAPAQLVLKAAAALRNTHPLALVTLPALLRTGVQTQADPSASGGIDFRSTQETEVLRDYFTLPHPPIVDRPFRALWAVKDDERWQKEKYAGGSLQRMRKGLSDSGRVLRQFKQGGGADRWQILPSAGSDLSTIAQEQQLQGQIRLVDLALWFGRSVDVSALDGDCTNLADDLDRLVCWFREQFNPDVADLVGTLYTEDVPPEYQGVPFENDPVDAETYEELGSLPPAPSYTGTLEQLASDVEESLTSEGFWLAEGLVRRVLVAWLSGDIVILVGQPGTGKSRFAALLANAMSARLDLDDPVTISVRADFDEAEFIGYERLDGSAQLRDFSTEILTTEEPLAARVVILEEMNLASVENYLASVLVATQETSRSIRLPSGERVQLPVDAFIIGTCNSYRDEPETRVRISSPTKRRSTVITMPNVLFERFERGGEAAVVDFGVSMVVSEANAVRARLASGHGSQFDALRLARLETLTSPADLADETRVALGRVCQSILETAVGSTWLTAGLLRDVTLAIAYAERYDEAELGALGEVVAEKLVHQLRGRHADVLDFRDAIAELPNADEIGALLERMMDGPSEQLIPLL